MNLIDECWIPVRRADGTQGRISPLMIGDPDVVALDAVRADFNGALAQFLIGLLQTTTPMNDMSTWKDLLASPPGRDVLDAWFSPVRDAFVLDGDGPRFMQDLTLSMAEEPTPVSALLLETPGEQSLKFNKDHFVKRDTVNGLCIECAAMALLTMQINAPAGGAGHRTSLRGGGPLTTLVISADEGARTLWKDLWLNVRQRSVFLGQGGDPAKVDAKFTFPWLADIARLQPEKGEFSPLQGHPAHVFWAMPRRIRLDFSSGESGFCDLCGAHSSNLVARYVTRNYGLNYKGAWNHPLSPYYESKPGEWLPLHPQPGGYGYRHWLPWVLGSSRQGKSQRPASVVSDFLTHHHRTGQFRLWAFGYDMDNMKARCWYESTLPIFGLASCDEDRQRQVQNIAGQWVEGAGLVALWLRDAVKTAWFGSGEVRGDLSHVDAMFFSHTEPAFYTLLARLIDQARVAELDAELSLLELREQWHQVLTTAARHLFDESLVGVAGAVDNNPRRLADAHKALMSRLRGDMLRETLGLAAPGSGKSKKGLRKVKEA
ncbi:MAG: type I-E CRISPR-associated protein Cse1/CasA [Pseudomonadota bacterium]